jgi:hypothetical protein
MGMHGRAVADMSRMLAGDADTVPKPSTTFTLGMLVVPQLDTTLANECRRDRFIVTTGNELTSNTAQRVVEGLVAVRCGTVCVTRVCEQEGVRNTWTSNECLLDVAIVAAGRVIYCDWMFGDAKMIDKPVVVISLSSRLKDYLQKQAVGCVRPAPSTQCRPGHAASIRVDRYRQRRAHLLYSTRYIETSGLLRSHTTTA